MKVNVQKIKIEDEHQMKVEMIDIGEQYQVNGEDEAVSFTHIWFWCSVYFFNKDDQYLFRDIKPSS